MKKKLLTVAGIGLVVLLISGVGVALAEGPAGGKAGIKQTFIGKVAKILGVEDQKLTDAVKQAQLEMLEDAVKAGKLTEEQANALKGRIEKDGGWGPPALHPPKGRPDSRGLGGIILKIEHQIKAVADFLGLKPGELMAELKQGKTLAQIGQEHGKSREQLKGAVATRVQKGLDEAVASGKLTQQKAEEVKQNLGEQIDKLLDASLRSQKQLPKGKPQGNSNKT